MDVNKDRLGRPLGIVPSGTRARKAWMLFAPVDFREKMMTVEQDTRFAMYKDLDKEVQNEYRKILKEAISNGVKIDTEEAMITAGELVGHTTLMKGKL